MSSESSFSKEAPKSPELTVQVPPSQSAVNQQFEDLAVSKYTVYRTVAESLDVRTPCSTLCITSLSAGILQ